MLSLWGEKPIFGRLSKNNTGMAVLRAGLPVTSVFHPKRRKRKKEDPCDNVMT